MKLAILTLSTIVALSAAQNLSGEPPCATACLSSAISKAGCDESDQGCQCGPTQASIGAIVATCLLASCPATQLAAVQSIGLALCAQYSAGLTVTTATTAAATVTSTAGSSSGGSLSTINGPTATSTSTTVAANGTVVSTTSAATVASSGTSGGSSGSSAASSASASAKSSGSATTSAPSTVSSSAAMALLANGIGGLAALLFGVAATL